jgi:hypothetical protein
MYDYNGYFAVDAAHERSPNADSLEAFNARLEQDFVERVHSGYSAQPLQSLATDLGTARGGLIGAFAPRILFTGDSDAMTEALLDAALEVASSPVPSVDDGFESYTSWENRSFRSRQASAPVTEPDKPTQTQALAMFGRDEASAPMNKQGLLIDQVKIPDQDADVVAPSNLESASQSVAPSMPADLHGPVSVEDAISVAPENATSEGRDA